MAKKKKKYSASKGMFGLNKIMKVFIITSPTRMMNMVIIKRMFLQQHDPICV